MHALTLIGLLLLVSGCANRSPVSPPHVQPPAIPELSDQARQPEPPEICLTGCSNGLTKLRTELLDTLTRQEPQG